MKDRLETKPARYYKNLESCGGIVYYLGIISAFFFIIMKWPEATPALSWIIIIIIFAFVIIRCIGINRHLIHQGKITKTQFTIKTTLDILGYLLTGITSIVIAGKLAQIIGVNIGNSVESTMPGLGIPAGIISGLITGAIAGIAVGFIVRTVWAKLLKTLHADT
jgi:hypothetical protein